jgi:cytoskeletal protein RodZ
MASKPDKTSGVMETAQDKTIHSFGRYLQAIRMEKGVSLETVSKETRIRMETLMQIEEEDHARLPQQTFVIGFLRSYAKVIGADGDEAVRRYLSRLEVARKIARSEADLNRSRKKFWPRLLVALVSLVVVIGLTLFTVSFLRDQTEEQQAPPPVENRPSASEPAAAPAPVVTPPPTAQPAADPVPVSPADPEPAAETIAETYSLQIQSTEDTWMQVTVDNQEPIEYSLAPGDKIDLEASAGYKLVIGNAGGVKLTLNDKPVQISGSSGQVVNLQLP